MAVDELERWVRDAARLPDLSPQLKGQVMRSCAQVWVGRPQWGLRVAAGGVVALLLVTIGWAGWQLADAARAKANRAGWIAPKAAPPNPRLTPPMAPPSTVPSSLSEPGPTLDPSVAAPAPAPPAQPDRMEWDPVEKSLRSRDRSFQKLMSLIQP